MPAPLVHLGQVDVPADLQRLLQARTPCWAGRSGPSQRLHGGRASPFLEHPTCWVRRREGVRGPVIAALAMPFEFAPSAYGVDGDAGYAAGSIMQGEGPAQPVIDFLFAIRRGSDRRWRIAAEATVAKTMPRYFKPITGAKVVAARTSHRALRAASCA